MSTGYACKACSAPATVDESGLHRSCSCNTTVVASMEAVAYGKGGAAEDPRPLLLALLYKIGLALRRRDGLQLDH